MEELGQVLFQKLTESTRYMEIELAFKVFENLICSRSFEHDKNNS